MAWTICRRLFARKRRWIDRSPGDCARNQETALAGGYYRGFTADHLVADAVARFRQRFGRDPEQVLQDRGILLLGPV